jgi:monoterpene epsilon-lactone hydrolase
MFERAYIVAYVSYAAATVTARRLLRGPKRPSWSLIYEIAVEVARGLFRHNVEESERTGRPIASPSASLQHSLRSLLTFESGTLAGLPAEWHAPRGLHGDAPTILYLHGGGYVSMAPASYRDLVPRIALAAGARCVVPNYRKAPKHPFPAANEDALACYRALLDMGVAPERLFIAGDSAGGGLSLATMLRLRDAGLPLPRAAILISPWVDLRCRDESLLANAKLDYLSPSLLDIASRQYAGTAGLDDAFVSPIGADLRGLPPMLVTTGEVELFFSQNHAFVDRARAAGVSVIHEVGPDMVHVFQLFAPLSETARVSIRTIGQFVGEHVPPGLPLPAAADADRRVDVTVA